MTRRGDATTDTPTSFGNVAKALFAEWPRFPFPACQPVMQVVMLPTSFRNAMLPCRSSGKRQQRHAFSLLEIIATVMILAVASVALSATLGDPASRSGKARCAVDELSSLLRMARNTAIAKQRPVRIRLAKQDSNTWLADTVDPSGLPAGRPIDIPLVPPSGVTLSGWPGAVQFDALGNSNTSLDVQVDYAGRAYRLRMYQASGVIRVNRP